MPTQKDKNDEVQAAKDREAADTPNAPVVAETPKPPSGQNRSLPPGTPRPPGDLRRRVARKQRTGPFVKFVGSASHRIIRPEQWGELNVELKNAKATHTWNVDNDKMIEASEFSDGQLDYMLIDDMQQGIGSHSFLLVDYDDSDPPQLVQVVEDQEVDA